MLEEQCFDCKNNWWISLSKSGNDTQPLRKRSDFKQALSTLQRLQQEAGEEPHVPTYSHKQRCWRRPTRARSLMESIDFFLHLVAMARMLVVYLRIR